jgi:hypothetical protein
MTGALFIRDLLCKRIDSAHLSGLLRIKSSPDMPEDVTQDLCHSFIAQIMEDSHL